MKERSVFVFLWRILLEQPSFSLLKRAARARDIAFLEQDLAEVIRFVEKASY